MYSNEFIQNIKDEIKRLEEVKTTAHARIMDLDRVLVSYQPIIMDSKAVNGVKRAYKTRKPVNDPQTGKADDNGSNGHPVVRGKPIKDLSEKAMAKRAYMAKWREAKRNAGIGENGFNNQPLKIKKANAAGAGKRFSLDRDFDLGERDLRLMISYLVSWKGMGRLIAEEIRAYAEIEGIPMLRFSPNQKELVRHLFYSARTRVVENAKSSSES